MTLDSMANMYKPLVKARHVPLACFAMSIWPSLQWYNLRLGGPPASEQNEKQVDWSALEGFVLTRPTGALPSTLLAPRLQCQAIPSSSLCGLEGPGRRCEGPATRVNRLQTFWDHSREGSLPLGALPSNCLWWAEAWCWPSPLPLGSTCQN